MWCTSKSAIVELGFRKDEPRPRKSQFGRSSKLQKRNFGSDKLWKTLINAYDPLFLFQVDVYDPGNGKLEDYHRIWKNKKPEEYNLTWLFPNNKRLPKNYTESLPSEYQDQLTSGDINSNVSVQSFLFV